MPSSHGCTVGKVGSASVSAGARHRRDAHRSASPIPSVKELQVCPIPQQVAKQVIVAHHYIHSFPGGTAIAFGVFDAERLMGVATLGVGPTNGFRLVDGATRNDCLTLSRMWLEDELPKNSESRVLGMIIRSLTRHTTVKFLLAYSDPSQGHLGVIYQATNWLYTGLSDAMPLYDLGDGVARHSRSLGQTYGTHSVQHFKENGVSVRLVPQSRKHRYLLFLDPSWRARLQVPVLPYPKREAADGRG